MMTSPSLFVHKRRRGLNSRPIIPRQCIFLRLGCTVNSPLNSAFPIDCILLPYRLGQRCGLVIFLVFGSQWLKKDCHVHEKKDHLTTSHIITALPKFLEPLRRPSAVSLTPGLVCRHFSGLSLYDIARLPPS